MEDDQMYVPKCANIRAASSRLTYETGYTSDEDNNSVLKSWPPARDRVVASREKCHNRLGGHKNNDANTLNDLDKDEAVGGGAAASISVPNHALNLSEESREEGDLIRLAGGRDFAFATLRDLEETFARDPSIIGNKIITGYKEYEESNRDNFIFFTKSLKESAIETPF